MQESDSPTSSHSSYLLALITVFRKHKQTFLWVPLIVVAAGLATIFTFSPQKYSVKAKYLVDSLNGEDIDTFVEVLSGSPMISRVIRLLNPNITEVDAAAEAEESKLSDYLKLETTPPFAPGKPQAIYHRIDIEVVAGTESLAGDVSKKIHDGIVDPAIQKSFFLGSLRSLRANLRSFSLQRHYSEKHAVRILERQLENVRQRLKSAKSETEIEKISNAMTLFDVGKMPGGSDEVERARNMIQLILVLPLKKQQEILESKIKESEKFGEYRNLFSQRWAFMRAHLTRLADFDTREEAEAYLSNIGSSEHKGDRAELSLIRQVVQEDLKETLSGYTLLRVESQPTSRRITLKVFGLLLTVLLLSLLAVHLTASVSHQSAFARPHES